jgi:membrane protein involved in colicin uptake
MKPDERYAELVAQAEKAVASVKDPSLKQIAFQKVLDDLLSSSEAARTSSSRASKAQKSKSKNIRGSARGGPTQYIQELIGDSFFKKPKTISEVKAELGNRGHHIALTSLSGPLQNLCKAKVLRRQKIKTSDKRQTFAYSVW